MITKNKINRQAKALLELYKTLPEKTRMEIKKMILEDEISFEEIEKSSELSQLSEKSIEELWDTPENEHWDEFFKQKGYV
ncbi:MAG: hypothetical protein ACFCU6_13280 [Balneolaceae bacterium]